MKDRLFKKFARGDAAQAGGLGLGLSIVRGFVVAQGGDIVVGENPGGGAVFTIYLPHSNPDSESSPMSQQNSISILVIDDEAQIRRLLTVTLESSGYVVRHAETGQQGLSEAALMPPDALIVDLGLPDMDGAEVIKRLEIVQGASHLVLSVRDQEADKIAALDARAIDYLTKPFGGRTLSQAQGNVAPVHGLH